MTSAPGRELLNQDPEALDVPQVSKPANASASETGAYAPIPFVAPFQGMLHPVLDPDKIDAQPDSYPKGF